MTEQQDARIKKELGVARTSRAAEDRSSTENRKVTDAERLEMFRNQMFNDALPDLPPLPGYHVCWLTTSNPRDPIHRRTQIGYTPVLPEEVPGMEFATLKTGEYAGLIGVNEMVAFKLPESLYQAFMREAHYDAPNREEGRLEEVARAMREQAERSGAALIEEEGFRDMYQAPPAQRDFA